MRLALRQRGFRVGLRRVRRLMIELGWIHPPRRRPYGLTHATTEIQEKENLIKQDFSAKAPFTKLLTDISQIQCQDGKLYISPILDCYDGEILALEMRDNMKKELCIDTFKVALKRFPIKGAILHSDRGSQYTSEAFREELREAGVYQSLSGVWSIARNIQQRTMETTHYGLPDQRLTIEKWCQQQGLERSTYLCVVS